MTLYHLVLFKVKPQFNQQTFQKVHEGFNSMSKTIPFVLKSAFGENKTQRGKGYTHALTVELASIEDLPKYIEHPLHVELATSCKQCTITEDTLAIDYEA